MEQRVHYNWIDSIKVFAIFLVLFGHFPLDERMYVYVFHMPLFLIISGFLYKKRTLLEEVKRSAKGLLIPYYLYCIVAIIVSLFRNEYQWQDIPFCIIGELEKTHFYFGPLWYLIALVVIRIIHSFIKEHSIAVSLIIVVLFTILKFKTDFYIKTDPFQVVSSCLSYPFFVVGYYLRETNFLEQDIRHHKYSFSLCCIFVFFLSLFCVRYVGHIGNLYVCESGTVPILSYIPSLACSLSIFFLFKVWFDIDNSMISVFSKGTLMIVALHMYFELFWINLFGVSFFLVIIYCFIILFSFYPLILLSFKYFPILVGGSQVKLKG